MISLQDSDDVPANLSLLFLPLSKSSSLLFFSKTQLMMQLPAVKKRAAAQGLSVSFHIGLQGAAYVRTYDVRSVGRK